MKDELTASLREAKPTLNPAEAVASFFDKPRAYVKRGEYPLELVIWIRESLCDALTNPEIYKDCVESALDQLKSLEKELLGENV